MPVFAVIYHYDPDKHDLRMEKRSEHRALLSSLFESGMILSGGAWEDDGAPGALLVAQGPDKAAIEAAFDNDPYHSLGVLAGREIRQWAQLYGPWRDPK
ncbi:MAG: YciI family protein [Nakamurella sp.]